MRRLSVLALAAVLLVALAAPAYAGGQHRGGNITADVALGLASLAVFNQVVAALTNNHRSQHRTVIYERPVVYAAPAPVIYQAAPMIVAPPPPPQQQVVQYPHGRYELQGSQWVWFPNAPAPPPAVSRVEPPPAIESCQPTGKWVKTPQGIVPECQ